MVTVVCAVCNKVFEKFLSEVTGSVTNKFYCNSSCYEIFRTKDTKTVPCDNCGKTLIRREKQIGESKKSYCSKTCAAHNAVRKHLWARGVPKEAIKNLKVISEEEFQALLVACENAR